MNNADSLIQGLKHAGLRTTPQRMAICELLAQSVEHPSAYTIYEDIQVRIPSLSLTTVYNTLETLVGLGLINELGDVGNEGMRFDADTSPHINLACLTCNKVIDLPSKHVGKLEEEVTETSGYVIQGARLLYYGLCPECHEKKLHRRT